MAEDHGFLLAAWDRVWNNRGACAAGVDGDTAHHIEAMRGVAGFLADLRARGFQPLPSLRRISSRAATGPPNRRSYDTVAEMHYLTPRPHWESRIANTSDCMAT
ncbi:hypothetical protein JJ691_31450 [Kutzneria sp. CA-103260]|nr:hypothetical protein JJ691_31450 [Kutzneria sp. CA-103260]